MDSITVNRNPSSDNGLANKKFIHESLGGGKILGFIQTLENFLKVSVGNDVYNLTKYEKIRNIDTTIMKHPNIGGYLLQNWAIKGSDKNSAGRLQNFIRSTKTNSPTGISGATSLHPIRDNFMFTETSAINYGPNVYCSFERTEVIVP